MKKIFLRLAILSTLFLLQFLFSNCNSDKKNDRDLGAMYKEMGEDKINEIQEAAILLGLKHEVNNKEVELILYDYYKEYDNYDYQLITTQQLDIVQWKDSWNDEPPLLFQYIVSAAKCFSVSEKIVAGIILDYRFLKYQEEFGILDSSIEDLRYELENSH